MAKPPSTASTTSIAATKTSRRSCPVSVRESAASADGPRRALPHPHSRPTARICPLTQGARDSVLGLRQSQRKSPANAGLSFWSRPVRVALSVQRLQLQIHFVLPILAAQDPR